MAEPRAPIEASTLGTDPDVPDPPPHAPDLQEFLTALLSAEDPAQQTRAASGFFSDPNVFRRVAEGGVTGLALRAAAHLPQALMRAVGARLLQGPQACEDVLRSGDAEQLGAALNIANLLTDDWDVAPIGQMAIGQLLVPAGCATAAASTPPAIRAALLAARQLPDAADGADDRTPLARDAREQLLTPQACETMARSAAWPDFAVALEAACELPDGLRQRAIGHLLSEHRCRALQVAGPPQADALLDQALGYLPQGQRAPISAWLGRPAMPLQYTDVLASVAARAGRPVQHSPVHLT